MDRDFEARPALDRLDEDLTDGGAQESLLELGVGLRVVPHAREVSAEIVQQFDHVFLFLRPALEHLALTLLGLVQVGELVTQTPCLTWFAAVCEPEPRAAERGHPLRSPPRPERLMRIVNALVEIATGGCWLLVFGYSTLASEPEEEVP